MDKKIIFTKIEANEMKNKLFNCLLASIFLVSQISFSQVEYDTDLDIVELDEIISISLLGTSLVTFLK